MPVTATWSGDTLLVFDIEQAKVSSYVDATVAAEDVSISPDFITPVVASGEIGFVAVTAERGVILRQPLQAAHNADSTWLAVSRFRPMSGVTDTLIFEPVRMITLTGHSNFIQPGAAHSTIAFGANGWTAVSAADGTYRILIRDADDNPVRQVCHAVEPLEPSPSEMGTGPSPRGVEMAHAAIAHAPPPPRLHAIGRMIVGAAGELWVDRQRPEPFTREGMFGPTGSTEVASTVGSSGFPRA